MTVNYAGVTSSLTDEGGGVVSAWCSRLATGRIASTRLRTEVSHSGDGSSVRGVMDRGKHLAFYLFCLLSVTKENRAATTGFT